MVGICGQDVHSRQHLPAHSGVRYDASGQSLRHCTTQHVWPEEHLCAGYVRRTQTALVGSIRADSLRVVALLSCQDPEAPAAAGGVVRRASVHLQCGSSGRRRVRPRPKTQVRLPSNRFLLEILSTFSEYEHCVL